MSSSNDENSICWSIEICSFFPFPYRQSIISCIFNSASQFLFYSAMQLFWVDGLCQTDISSTFTPETGGKHRWNGAAGFVCQPACTEQARRQDSLLNQAQSPSALSRILIWTSVTSTAHVAKLGLLLCTVQHVQAVTAWGQHFTMPLSSQFWAQICDRSPIQCPETLQCTDFWRNACRLQQLPLPEDKNTALCLLQLWA